MRLRVVDFFAVPVLDCAVLRPVPRLAAVFLRDADFFAEPLRCPFEDDCDVDFLAVDFFAAVFFLVDLPLPDDFDFEEPPLELCTSPSWITPVQPSTSSGSSSVWLAT